MQNIWQEDWKMTLDHSEAHYFNLCSSQIPVCTEKRLITWWNHDPITTYAAKEKWSYLCGAP